MAGGGEFFYPSPFTLIILTKRALSVCDVFVLFLLLLLWL